MVPAPPSDPSDPGPDQTPDGPAPVGAVMFAVDLSNNFIVFGRGSPDQFVQSTVEAVDSPYKG